MHKPNKVHMLLAVFVAFLFAVLPGTYMRPQTQDSAALQLGQTKSKPQSAHLKGVVWGPLDSPMVRFLVASSVLYAGLHIWMGIMVFYDFFFARGKAP